MSPGTTCLPASSRAVLIIFPSTASVLPGRYTKPDGFTAFHLLYTSAFHFESPTLATSSRSPVTPLSTLSNHILNMPTTVTTTSSNKVAETHTTDAARIAQGRDVAPVSASATSDLTREESLLKEYSKELYVYTLDQLNSVRIDNAHKGVNGKAYMLKRTVSDIAVPLKTMAIGGGAETAKGAKGAAAPA